jgi:hypothetical protein
VMRASAGRTIRLPWRVTIFTVLMIVTGELDRRPSRGQS